MVVNWQVELFFEPKSLRVFFHKTYARINNSTSLSNLLYPIVFFSVVIDANQKFPSDWTRD